jgi:hypothetical protein
MLSYKMEKIFDNIWAIVIFDIFHMKLDELTENRLITKSYTAHELKDIHAGIFSNLNSSNSLPIVIAHIMSHYCVKLHN